jgi:hypothetical protein
METFGRNAMAFRKKLRHVQDGVRVNLVPAAGVDGDVSAGGADAVVQDDGASVVARGRGDRLLRSLY